MRAAFPARGDQRNQQVLTGENGTNGRRGISEAMKVRPSMNERDNGQSGKDKAQQVRGAIALAGPGVAHGNEHSAQTQSPSIGMNPDPPGF